MGNPISKHLPAAMDSWLQSFAQATGLIKYSDIMDFGGAWDGMLPEKRSAAETLIANIQAACADSMLDPDETMRSNDGIRDMCEALAEIVRQDIGRKGGE